MLLRLGNKVGGGDRERSSSWKALARQIPRPLLLSLFSSSIGSNSTLLLSCDPPVLRSSYYYYGDEDRQRRGTEELCGFCSRLPEILAVEAVVVTVVVVVVVVVVVQSRQ